MTRDALQGSSPSGRLAANLDDLLQIGNVYVPALATTYATLNQMAANLSDQAQPLFAWTPGGGGDSSGVAAQWTTICVAMQNAFADTATDLQDTAKVILEIEHDYESTDHDLAQEIKSVGAGDEQQNKAKGYQDSYPPVTVTKAGS